MREISVCHSSAGNAEAEFSCGFENAHGLVQAVRADKAIDSAAVIFDSDDHAAVFMIRCADLVQRAHEALVPRRKVAAGSQVRLHGESRDEGKPSFCSWGVTARRRMGQETKAAVDDGFRRGRGPDVRAPCLQPRGKMNGYKLYIPFLPEGGRARVNCRGRGARGDATTSSLGCILIVRPNRIGRKGGVPCRPLPSNTAITVASNAS